MKRRRGLAPCERIRVLGESLGEGIGEGAARLQRPRHFGEAVSQPPRTAADVEWNQPEPMRQVVCAVGGRARKMEL